MRSIWDVEELLAERSNRSLPRNDPTLGGGLRTHDRPTFTGDAPKPHTTWHLDEVFVSIGGKWMYLWRAVDAEGEVLDCLVQSRRDKRAAKKLMRKLLKKQGFAPSHLVTDHLKSYPAAFQEIGLTAVHQRGKR